MAGEIAEDRLCSIVNRIERLNEELKALNDDKTEVFKEAKDDGFDTAVIKHVIKLRKMDSTDLNEFETLVDLYKRALGMLTGVQMAFGGSVSVHAHTHAHEGGDDTAAEPAPDIDPETGEVRGEDTASCTRTRGEDESNGAPDAETATQDSQFATDAAPDGNHSGTASTGLDANIVDEDEAGESEEMPERDLGRTSDPDGRGAADEPPAPAGEGSNDAPADEDEEPDPPHQSGPDEGQAVPVGPQHVVRQAAGVSDDPYRLADIPPFLKLNAGGGG